MLSSIWALTSILDELKSQNLAQGLLKTPVNCHGLICKKIAYCISELSLGQRYIVQDLKYCFMLSIFADQLCMRSAIGKLNSKFGEYQDWSPVFIRKVMVCYDVC